MQFAHHLRLLLGTQGQAPPAAAPRTETVVLPAVDARGRAMPGAFGRESAAADLDDRGARFPAILILCCVHVEVS